MLCASGTVVLVVLRDGSPTLVYCVIWHWLSKHHLSKYLSRVNSTAMSRKAVQEILLKGKKPRLIACSYVSVLMLSCIVISREGWSHWVWNPAHLLAPQVQQKHLRTELLQLYSSTGISRCICFQGTSNPGKLLFKKVCHLLFRLKKLKRGEKEIKKFTFGVKTKQGFLFLKLF